MKDQSTSDISTPVLSQSVNPILNTDSYKLSHFLQYPPGTRAVSAYVEARRGGEMDHVLLFGLQMFLMEYLSRRVTAADIDEAEEIATLHGLPFNRTGWERIVDRHGGYLPIEIEALPEGDGVFTVTAPWIGTAARIDLIFARGRFASEAAPAGGVLIGERASIGHT